MLKVFRAVLTVLAVVSLFAAPVYAATSGSSNQSGIVQSYATDMPIQQGMIVGTVSGDSSKVVSLTSDHINDMLGVAISASDAPITLSGDSKSQVYVATSGIYNVLVSDQNGAIKVGDYISISSLDGIGMKTEDTEAIVLGRASANLTDSSLVEKNVLIKKNGTTTAVNIGIIPVTITVGNNPTGGHGSGNLPGFLEIAAGGIAGQTVSAGRVYLALAVLILAAFISGSLMYSGVRGSLLSIGRNPLAKKFIIRGLIQTVLTGVIIFIIGLFAVYLLLKL